LVALSPPGDASAREPKKGVPSCDKPGVGAWSL